MPIRMQPGPDGKTALRMAFRKNWKHYLQEAAGLGLFMIAACFFGAMLFSEHSPWQNFLPGIWLRNLWMGLMMGATALFIFYAPFTAQSGAHINPAVTLVFFRLNRMCRYDALFFVIAQVLGGTLAVYGMRLLMGKLLTDPPVNSVVTVPGTGGWLAALGMEWLIAFVTMSMVLFTSSSKRWQSSTRIMAAILVCTWVMVAGPVSGFGMNPARTLASALPSGIWTHYWIYLLAPVTGMLAAAETWRWVQQKRVAIQSSNDHV